MKDTSVSRFLKKRPHEGLGLLEWLVVCTLALVAMGILAGQIGDTTSIADINTESQHIITLATNARDSRASSGYPTGSLMSQLNSRQGVPSDMTNTNGVVTNTWGGAVDITGNGTYFTLSYAKVPQEACAKIATRLSKNSLFSATMINSTSVTGEVTPASASTMCKSGSNTLSWLSNQ